MQFRQLGRCGVLIVLSFIVTPRAFAQTLIDRVPDDAMVYIGWKGTDALGPAYDKSKLKQFVDHSAIPELFNKTLPELIEKQANNEPGKAEDIKTGSEFFTLIAKHPTALYGAGFEAKGDEEPRPRFGIICQAGADSETVLAVFAHLAEQNKDDADAPRAIADGEVVALIGGYDKDAKPFAKGIKSLEATADFIAAKSHLTQDAAVVFYLDAAKLLSRIDSAVKQDKDEQSFTVWSRVKEAAGLTGLKRYIYSAGFVGEDWASRSFLDAPAPRKGLMKLLEPAPIDPALMARVPGDATSASIRQFDFAALIDTAKAIATAANPDAGQKFQQGLGFISLSLGRRLDTELLAPLGAQWAIYGSPALGNGGVTSMVIANKLDDAKLAKAAWGDLAFAISNTVPNLVRKNMNVVVTPKVDDKTIVGATVFSWQIANTPWAPGFVVKDNFIYFSGTPEALVKAANLADAKFESNTKFAKVLSALAAPSYSGVSFDDLPASAETKTKAMEENYAMLADRARAEGIDPPAKLLPSLEEVKGLLSPSGSASWADDKGFYSVERSPFPGSTLAYGYSGSDQMTTVGVGALGVSILLPSLNKARETANRVKASSNLRQIGMACMLYANENNGAAPPDLSALLAEGLTVEVFTSPSSSTTVPANIRDGTIDQQSAWVKENSDYVYVKPVGKISNAGPDTPLAYEKAGIHDRDGINILYGDGHVEFQLMKNAVEAITQATGQKPVEYAKPARVAK